jgi:hypothetical protein
MALLGRARWTLAKSQGLELDPLSLGLPSRSVVRDAREGGGIGRRARFRFWWPKGRGGSSPLLRTRFLIDFELKAEILIPSLLGIGGDQGSAAVPEVVIVRHHFFGFAFRRPPMVRGFTGSSSLAASVAGRPGRRFRSPHGGVSELAEVLAPTKEFI